MANLQRCDLRIGEGNADEAAVVDAVSNLTEHGAKGRFFRERLLRGYALLMREVEGIQRESDPLAALDRLSQSINSGHYKTLKSLLRNKMAAAASSQAAAKPPEPAPAPPTPSAVLEQQEVVANAPVALVTDPVPVEPLPAPVPVAALPDVVAEVEPLAESSVIGSVVGGDEPEAEVEEETPPAPPVPSWSRFASLAGSTGQPKAKEG